MVDRANASLVILEDSRGIRAVGNGAASTCLGSAAALRRCDMPQATIDASRFEDSAPVRALAAKTPHMFYVTQHEHMCHAGTCSYNIPGTDIIATREDGGHVNANMGRYLWAFHCSALEGLGLF